MTKWTANLITFLVTGEKLFTTGRHAGRFVHETETSIQVGIYDLAAAGSTSTFVVEVSLPKTPATKLVEALLPLSQLSTAELAGLLQADSALIRHAAQHAEANAIQPTLSRLIVDS